jgi:hypothetical protein
MDCKIHMKDNYYLKRKYFWIFLGMKQESF